MSRWSTAARVVSAVLLAASTLAASEPSAAPPSGVERVVLILDASASMQGKLGKRTKMEIAREVTHDLLKDWDPRIQLGLTAYGHRDGSCEDIEAVVPVSRLEAPSFLSQVDRLRPKGKTPITAAVKNAAEQLGFAARKATVILISDGVESCGGDLCALASQLEKQGIDFTAHVVGFGVTAKETKQLACLAKNTGGQYRAAKDAPALKQALGHMVEDVKQRSELAPPKIVWAPGIRPLADETLPGEPIKFRAVRVPDGALLRADWNIYEAGKTEVLEHHNSDASPQFRLSPGKYRVEGTMDLATFAYPFEVAAGTNHLLEVAFNSGEVTFKSFMIEGGPPIAGRIYLKSEDGRHQLSNKPGTQIVFELPAGRYQAQIWVDNVARQESAVVTRTIEIKPGDKTSQDVSLNVGRIKLKVVASAGGPAIEKRLYVHELTPNGSVGELYDDLPNNVDWVLAAGTYALRFRTPTGQFEKKFSVQAGAHTSEEIVMPP